MYDRLNTEQMELAQAGSSCAAPAMKHRGPVATLLAVALISAALMFAMPSLAYASQEAGPIQGDSPTLESSSSSSSGDISVNKAPDKPDSGPTYSAIADPKESSKQQSFEDSSISGVSASSYTTGDNKSSTNDKDSDDDSDSDSSIAANQTEDGDDSYADSSDALSNSKDDDDSTDDSTGALSNSTDELTPDDQGDQPTGSDSKTDDVIATPDDKGSADQNVGTASDKNEEVTPDKSNIGSDDSTGSLNSIVTTPSATTPSVTGNSDSIGTQGTELKPQAEGITIMWNFGWSAKPSAVSAVTPYDPTTATTGYRTLGAADDPIFDNAGNKICNAGDSFTLSSAQEGVDLGLDKPTAAYNFRYGYTLTMWAFHIYNATSKQYQIFTVTTFKNLASNTPYKNGNIQQIVAYPIFGNNFSTVEFKSAATNAKIDGYGGQAPAYTVFDFPEHSGSNNQWNVYEYGKLTGGATTPATEGMTVLDMVNTLTNFRSSTTYNSGLWKNINLLESENSTSYKIDFEVGTANTGKVTVSGNQIKVDNNGTTRPTAAQITAANASATDSNKNDGWVLDGTKWTYTMGTTTGTLNSLADLANIAITADMKVSPVMKQNTYSVTLNAGKAPSLNSVTSPISVATPTTTVTLGNPTWSGYTFLGWGKTAQTNVGDALASTNKVNSGTAFNTITGANEDTTTVTLYAWWDPNKLTITFNGNKPTNGGTVANLPANVTTHPYGTNYTIPTTTPTSNGYTFAGWNTAANGTGTAYAAGATINNVTAAQTLYAQWTEKSGYIVTFKGANGSTAVTANFNQVTGLNWTSNVTVPAAGPTAPAGYSFAGWYNGTAASATKISGTANVTKSYKDLLAQVNASATDTTTEIVLYAKWTELGKLTFTMDLNGTGASYNSSTSNYTNNQVLNGGYATIPTATNPTRPGYNFIGWSDSASGAVNSAYTAGANVGPMTANKTIYARWTAAPITITYKQSATGDIAGVTNNAAAGQYTVTKNYGEVLAVPGGSTMYTRPGYTFSSWQPGAGKSTVSANGGNLTLTDANIVLTSTGSSSDGTLAYTATIYPNWTAIKYTIVWNTQNGTPAIANTTNLDADSTIALPSQTLTRAGYTFQGWYTTNTGTGGKDVKAGNKLNDTWTISNTVTTVNAYAIWKENIVEMKFTAVNPAQTNVSLNGDASTVNSGKIIYVGAATGTIYSDAAGTTSTGKNLSAGISPSIVDSNYEWRVYSAGNDLNYTSRWTTGSASGAVVAAANIDSNGKLTVPKTSGIYMATDYYLRVSPKKYSYTIEHYQQNVEGTAYVKATTPADITGTQFYGHTVMAGTTAGATGMVLTVVPTATTGFTYNGSAVGAVNQVTIGAGANVLKFYYDRNTYTLDVTYTGTVPAGVNYSPARQTVKYGQSITLTRPDAVDGYTWSGWSQTSGTTITPVIAGTATRTFTMPASNVAITGTWGMQTFNATFKADTANNGVLTVTGGNNSHDLTFGSSIPTAKGIPSVVPANANAYYFAGWDLYVNCGTVGNQTSGTLLRTVSPDEILGQGAYVGNAWTIPSNVVFVARMNPVCNVNYVAGTGGAFASTAGHQSGTNAVTTGGATYAALQVGWTLPEFFMRTDPSPLKVAAGFDSSVTDARNQNNPKAAPGYKFTGWTWRDNTHGTTHTVYGYYNAAGKFVKTSGDDMPTTVDQSYTFNAMWEKTYQQIHFVNTCAAGTGVTGVATPATLVADRLYQMGDTIALPTTSTYAASTNATAYTFKGWTTSSNYRSGDPLYNTSFTMTAGTESSAYTFIDLTDPNLVRNGRYGVTLYPVFEEKNVTINYALATGITGTMGSLSKSTETIKQATGTATGSTATAKTGYKFVGWFDNAAHTGTAISTNAAFLPSKTSGIYTAATYYAYYEPEEYTITFKIGDHGTWQTPAGDKTDKTVQLAYNTTYGTNVPATKGDAGYGFVNWKLEGGTTTYTTAQLQSVKITGPATWVAQWEARSGFNLAFETNGGAPTLTTKQVTWTASIAASMDSTSSNIKRQGYTFAGWYAMSDFSAASLISTALNCAGATDTFATGIAKSGQTVSADDDTATLTLYAKWTPNNYTIKYTPNWPATNSTTFADRTAQWTDTALLPPSGETLSMDGYTFTGWVAKNGTKTYTVTNAAALSDIYVALYGASDYSTTKTITIEAQWGTKTYTVKFQDPSGVAKNTVNNLKWGDTVNYYSYDPGAAKRLVGWKFTPDGNTEQQWTNSSLSKLVSEIGGDVNQATNGKTYILTAILEDNTAYTIQYYKVDRDATGTPNVAGATEVTAAKKTGYLTPGQAYDIKAFKPVGQNNPSNEITTFANTYKNQLKGYVLDETVSGTKIAVVAAEVTDGGTIAFKVYYVEKMLDVEYLLGVSAIGNKPYAGSDPAPATKNLGWNSSSVLPDTTPTWEGYKAPKWQYQNASGTWVDVPAGAKVSALALNDDTKTKITLRALWDSDQVRITYAVQPGGNASNGAGFTVAGGNSKYQDLDAVGGTPYTMTATAASGYTFEGWYLDGVLLAGGAATITPQKGTDGLFATSTYEAHFRALGAINYTIEHYYEGLDGTYTHNASENTTRSGQEFSTINKTADMERNVKGFTFKSGITGEKLTITSLKAGEVLKLYYERNEHAVRVQTAAPGADAPTSITAPTYPATGITQANTTQKYNTNLVMPSITAPAGWSVKWNVTFRDSDAAAPTTLTLANGAPFVMPDAVVDIIAVWSRQAHEVSFNAGDDPHGTVEVVNGKTLPFTVDHGKLLTDTSSTGNYVDIKATPDATWALKGWQYTDADGTVKTTQDPNSVVINSDLVFKALWAQTYSVIYSPDCVLPGVGNHGGNGFTAAVTAGDEIKPDPVHNVNEFQLMVGGNNVTTNAPAEAGYRFVGWTWENAGNAHYWINPAITDFDVSVLTGTAATMDFDVTGNIFFRAIWEAMEQDLSYRLQITGPESQWAGVPAAAGTANTDPYVVLPKPRTDEVVTLLTGADVHREGYIFAGWAVWTDANGDGVITDNELGAPITGGTFKMPANAVVMVPVWEFDSISISFEVAAGSAGKGTLSKTHQNIVDPTATTLSGSQAVANAGYTFEGWYVDADCTIKVDDSWVTNGLLTPHMPAGGWVPATFYAKFVAGNTEYTIEYYMQNDDDSFSLKESHRYGDIMTEDMADVMDENNPAFQHILSFDGYNFDSTIFESVLRAVVAGDGSTVLKLYYTWTPYEITINYIKNDTNETFDNEVLTGVRVSDPNTYVLPTSYINAKRPAGYTYVMQELVSAEGTSLVMNVFYGPVSFFVNFNANGGKYDDDTTVKTYEGLNLDSKPANNIGDTKPALMGYVLGEMPTRWNTKADGTGMWLDTNTTLEQLALALGNGAYDEAALLKSGLTLYAIWSERGDLEVIYDLNNDPVKNPNIIKNVPDFLEPEIVDDMTGVAWSQAGLNVTHQAEWYAAPHGYKFVGWNTAADGSGLTITSTTRYSEISRYLSPDVALSKITLYAQWEEIIVRIEYTTEEGGTITRFVDNVSAVTGQHVGEGSSAGTRLTSVATAKPGYHFVGWELVTGARNGGLTTLADYLYNQANDWTWNEDGTITLADPGEFGRLYSATYIARFEANPESTIRYFINAERGTGYIADTKLPHGTENVKISDGKDFNLSHYTLVRWNTKADGTGDWYNFGQVITMPEEGLDLYAIWDINSYGVTVADRYDWVAGVTGGNTKVEWGQPLSSEFISSLEVKPWAFANFAGWHYRMVDADTGEVIEGIIDDLSELVVLGELEIEALFETTSVPDTMPQTGDNDVLFVLIALIALSLGLIIFAGIKLRDDEDEEDEAYAYC